MRPTAYRAAYDGNRVAASVLCVAFIGVGPSAAATTASLDAQIELTAACSGDDPKAAVAACTELIDTKDPDVKFQTAALVNRGNAYDALGEPARALADYERALELDPGSAFSHRNKGVALARLGRLSEALLEFVAAVELKPDYVEAYGSRAETLMKMAAERGEPDGASVYKYILADYDKMIEIGGLGRRGAVAFDGRGKANYHLGHLDAAIADYTEAIALTPEPRFLMARAVAYADAGDSTRANADIDRAEAIVGDVGVAAATAAGLTPAALQNVRDYIAKKRK